MRLHHIPLARLHAHPLNSNVMAAAAMDKLVRHIERTGSYQPLIVRPRPRHGEDEEFEIMDGHHRCEVLRRLGHAAAACVVWDVDDEAAMLLLSSLNRLHGQDDPRRRGELLRRLREQAGDRSAELMKLLPDSSQRLARLCEMRQPPAPRPPRELGDMAAHVHFFLTGEQRRRLDAALKQIGGRREDALMSLVTQPREGATT